MNTKLTGKRTALFWVITQRVVETHRVVVISTARCVITQKRQFSATSRRKP